MKSILDVCYSEKNKQYLDVHLPEEGAFDVFVYFHGGGLERGDKRAKKCNTFFENATEHGIAVVSCNYRMYPDAAYPDYIEDAADAVAWVLQNMKNYGEVKSVFVGGSSAGGYLSQMLCFDASWLADRGVAPGDIAGYVLDAGQPTSHFNVLRERGLHTKRIVVDEAAPLYYLQPELTLPPMLIIVSDDDIKLRYEQTQLLVATLNYFGYGDLVELREMNGKHCAYVSAIDEEGRSVFGRLVIDFIEKVGNSEK